MQELTAFPPADAWILKLIVRLMAKKVSGEVASLLPLVVVADYLSSSLCHAQNVLPPLCFCSPRSAGSLTCSEPTGLRCHYLVHTNHRHVKIYKWQFKLHFTADSTAVMTS